MTVINPHTTRAPGTVLTAAIYNFDHTNHISNASALNAAKIEGATPPVVAGHGVVFADTTGAAIASAGFAPIGNSAIKTYVGGTVGGTANAVTVTGMAPSGYSLGNKNLISFQPTASNTGATTLNLETTGVNAVLKPSGAGMIALAGGEFQNNVPVLLYWDGANYLIIGPNISVGKQSLWVLASSMTPIQPSKGTLTVAGASIDYLAYDPTAVEDSYFSIAMPKGWNEGALSYKVFWAHPATTTNFGVTWELFATCFSDNEAITGAALSGVAVTDTGGVTSNLYISAETSIGTPGSSPAEGDLMNCVMRRVATDGGDTLAVDAFLAGVLLLYTTNNAVDN